MTGSPSPNHSSWGQQLPSALKKAQTTKHWQQQGQFMDSSTLQGSVPVPSASSPPHSSFMVLLLSREIRLAPGCVKLERSRNIQKQLERSLLYDESLGLKNSKLTSLLESAETLWRSTIKPLHYQTTVSSTLRSTQYAFLSKSSECLTLSNG